MHISISIYIHVHMHTWIKQGIPQSSKIMSDVQNLCIHIKIDMIEVNWEFRWREVLQHATRSGEQKWSLYVGTHIQWCVPAIPGLRRLRQEPRRAQLGLQSQIYSIHNARIGYVNNMSSQCCCTSLNAVPPGRAPPAWNSSFAWSRPLFFFYWK